MKKVFQTKFGYPTGNCFNAAVASVLELAEIPPIDPTLPQDEWVTGWCKFFDGLRVRWISTTWEPERSNWECFPRGLAIAHVEVCPGILHAIVCDDGKPIHDVMPDSPFLRDPSYLASLRVVSWSYFGTLEDGQQNNFDGTEKAEYAPAPR